MKSDSVIGSRLSSLQSALWARRRLCDDFPEKGVCCVRIIGRVDRFRLSRSINRVVARHEALRTSFLSASATEAPIQIINSVTPVSLDEGRFKVGASQSAAGLSACLIEETPDQHVLMLTAPILALDHTSYRRLLDEITAFYSEDVIAEESEPFQYADFADSEDEFFETETAGMGRAYWRSVLERDHDEAEHPVQPSSERHVSRATIERDSIIPLESLASRANAPLFAIFLSCSAILDGRIAGRPEPLITYCHPGRGCPELDAALGIFEKYLPIRPRLQSCGTFEELVTSVRDIIEENDSWHLAYVADQECPELLRAPSFRWEEGVRVRDVAGVRFVEERIEAARRYGPSELLCRRSGESVDIVMNIEGGGYGARTMAERFRHVLRQVAERPEIAIDEIDLLTPRERRQVLGDWTRTQRPYEASCAHMLFERQAECAPDRVAVVYEDQQLSSGSLNESANRLARYLMRVGVGVEVRVALCIDRSPEMVIGLLGVLKAGGAYVPIDPSYPAERLSQMLEESQAPVVLTCERFRGCLPATWAQVINLGLDQDDWANEPPTNPRVDMSDRHLAYLIFTSGSTGQPKAVGIEHAQLVNYVKAIGERLNLEVGLRMALISTIAADLGHTMLYPALCLGGELHLISEACGLDRTLWRQYRAQRGIQCVKITPSHARALIQEQTELPSRLLVLGGEVCVRDWIDHARAETAKSHIVNHYGPTECTVGAVTHSLVVEESELVPIGKPLNNVTAFVVDRNDNPVPVETPGELLIGGRGVGRGYVNDAALTAERFAPDPHGGEGARLYRTGDRVRWREDGEMEFLGRVDGQVKLRGYRIELADVEAALRQHGSVRNCAVCLKGNQPGAMRLIAYVVGADSAAPTESELKEYLRSKLPDHMIPSRFVELSGMPLTANGKLDRNALPIPETETTTAEMELPRTPTEALVAEIWSEVLRLEQVGVSENFFELGGHSLLATQVISRLADVFEVDVPLRALFETPTVRGLAEAVQSERAGNHRVKSQVILPVNREQYAAK